MIHLEFSSLIQRPVADVYAFVATPTNIPRWQSNIHEVKPSSSGPVMVGSTFQSAGEIIGRKIEGSMTVTEMDPEKTFRGTVRRRVTVRCVSAAKAGPERAGAAGTPCSEGSPRTR